MPTKTQSTAKKKCHYPPEDIWWEYIRTGRSDEKLRNKLIVRYKHLVEYQAGKLLAKLPKCVEEGDLITPGIFGLMDVIATFDPIRGIKFETYSSSRIRGAMLDEIRSNDWVPRLVRSRASTVGDARGSFESEFGYTPNDEEMAKYLNISSGEYKKIHRDATPTGTVSLSRKWFDTDSDKEVREIDTVADDNAVEPWRHIERVDIKALLTTGLNRVERLIIVLYYFEQLTMKEIGRVLDLSESRVSQMHGSCLKQMRGRITDPARPLFGELDMTDPNLSARQVYKPLPN